MATGRNADVIVAGAGIFGLACAAACLEAGLSVVVLERRGVGAGASGGVVGAMAPHVPEGWSAKKQFQLQALLSASAYWTSVDARSGLTSGYGRLGRLQPLHSQAERDRALRREQAAALRWGSSGTWKVLDSSTNLPFLAPFGAIRDDLSARINPAAACRSLAAAIRAMGGEIREGVEVLDAADGQVATAGGSLSAAAIIIAAGVETFGFVSPGSGCGVKGQAALLRPVQPFNGPIIQTSALYIVPHADGTVAVGSTSEDSWSHDETDENLDRLLEAATGLIPALAGAEVLVRWAGIRPKARGRDPMAGAISGTKSLFVATGGFKTAFGIAHEVGQAMARLVTGDPARLPPSFSPQSHGVWR